MGEEGIGFSWDAGNRRYGGASAGGACVAEPEGLGEKFPLFPKGCLTLVVGEPGTGKSMVTLELAARMSVRAAMPPGKRVENRVSEEEAGKKGERAGMSVVFAREDSVKTTQYRLMSARADMRFVRVMAWGSLVPDEEEMMMGEEARSPVQLALEEILKEGPVGLVVLDPLPAFLESFDVANASTIRRLLTPLLGMAEEHDFALVGVMHVSKGGRRLVHRAMGSQAYTALARSVMVVTQDDEKWERDRRLVVPVKNTYAPIECGYGFWIRQFDLRKEVADLLPLPYVVWEEEQVVGHRWQKSAGREVNVEDEEGRAAREVAKEFLRAMLAAGSCRSAKVLREGREVGISERTLRRAKMELGVRCWRDGEGWVMGVRTEAGGPRSEGGFKI